jgi:F0F1-type ATP synthase assembly protein I
LNGFASRIRPFRTVLRWQLIATAVLSLVAAIPWGGEGALSAALGGGVNVVAGGAYGWRVALGEARTAGEALATMFRAWGIKVLLIVVQLMLVLSFYRDIVHAAFFAAFVVTVAVFAAAVAVREPGKNKIHN